MKLKFALVLLVGVAFIYSACKKSSSNPQGPALSPQAVSSQVALNITQTLFGGLGAFNASQGLNAPNNLGVVHHNKIGLNDVNADPLCGVIADTTLNYSVTLDTAQASIKGNVKFAFTCAGGILSGFNVTENLQIAESSPNASISYGLGEDLTLLSTDPTLEESTFSLNGTLNETVGIQYKTGSKQTNNDSFDYVFKSLIISPNSGDVASGTATFTTKGSGASGTWNYTGSITFLPNDLLKIVINGITYTIDRQTGKVVS